MENKIVDEANKLVNSDGLEPLKIHDASSDLPAIRKRIISLALPSITEFMIHMTIGIVDLAFVGRLGAEATAASGMAWQIIWFTELAFFGVNAGVTALVARNIGAGDEKAARRAAGQALMITMFLAFLCTLFFIYYAEGILRLLGSEDSVITLGSAYIRILASTFLCSALMFCITTVLKSTGDTRTPMIIAAATSILNIILDYGLIFGKFGLPEHGALGSAEASAIVIFLGSLFAIAGILLGWFKIKISPDDIIRFDKVVCWKIIKIGIPVSMEQLAWSLAYAVIIWIVARSGTVHLAVHNIILKAESLSFMPGVGFSVAAKIAVGQALGEGSIEKAKLYVWESVKIGMMLMGSAGLAFLLIPQTLVSFFSVDPEVIALGASTLFVLGIIQPIQGMLFVLLGAFKGAGDTKAVMIIALAGMMLVRIPLSYFFGITLGLGVLGAWGGGMGIDIAVRAYICYKRFLGSKWADVTL